MSETREILDMCCGGKKKCPVLHVDHSDAGDGDIVIADLDQSPAPIRLTREQAMQVHAWLGNVLAR